MEGDPDKYVTKSDKADHQLTFSVLSRLNKKEIALFSQDAPPSLQKYADAVAEAEDKKDKHYKAAIEARKSGQDSTALVPVSRRSQALQPIEKPLPANKVKHYDPDVFGLENAAADCRFEMIKIVREVHRPLVHLLSARYS